MQPGFEARERKTGAGRDPGARSLTAMSLDDRERWDRQYAERAGVGTAGGFFCREFSTAATGKYRPAAPWRSPAAAGATRCFSPRAAFKSTPSTFLRSA